AWIDYIQFSPLRKNTINILLITHKLIFAGIKAECMRKPLRRQYFRSRAVAKAVYPADIVKMLQEEIFLAPFLACTITVRGSQFHFLRIMINRFFRFKNITYS